MKFTTTLELGGKTATGIRIPEEIVEGLGAGKRPPVKVTINEYTYRSSVASMGGVYVVGVSAEVREAAGVKANDVVTVEIELDTQPREVVIPSYFSEALNKNASAKKFFETLSYSNKRRIVLAIEAAKTEETKIRRVDSTIAKLIQGKI